jgi:hypothetical protein
MQHASTPDDDDILKVETSCITRYILGFADRLLN